MNYVISLILFASIKTTENFGVSYSLCLFLLFLPNFVCFKVYEKCFDDFYNYSTLQFLSPTYSLIAPCRIC